MVLGSTHTLSIQRNNDSLSAIIIGSLALLIGLIVVILIVWNTTKRKNRTHIANDNFTGVAYTHCSTKKLNWPLRNAFTEKGIIFLSPGYVYNLAHQPSRQPRQIIYIPCNYNNSDWDIHEFLKTIKPSRTTGAAQIITAAVLGCNKLCSKNGLWSVLERVYRRDGAKTITPESWVITAQIPQFKQIIHIRGQSHNTSNTRSQAFILKKNIQGKQGLLLSNSPATLGGLLATPDKYAVAQRYLPNPYLIHGRKLNIRLYVLITISRDSSPAHPEWWLYTRGKCIYTNRTYTPLPANTTIRSGSEQDLPLLEQHFTSLNLDSDRVYSQEHCPESLDELYKYMSRRGEDWTLIWHKIQLGLKKVVAAYQDKLSIPGVVDKAYQIFGVDYIISADPKTGKPQEPYLLEFNKGPEMKFKSPQDHELKSGLQIDILELVLGTKNTPHITNHTTNHPANQNTNQDKWIQINSKDKSKGKSKDNGKIN